MGTDLVVVIATHGRAGLLGRTLESLATCQLPSEYRETIVVENGPKCGADRIVGRAPAVLRARYLHEEVANKSTALNRALAELDDCLIFFSDDDVRFAPEILEEYTRAARSTGPGTFFGGPTACDYETPPPGWLKRFLPASARGWRLDADSSDGDKACFLGFNWAAFSRDLKALGGFDYRRGPGSPTGSTGQESDMQRRMLSAGYSRLYVPEALVWHYVPADRCSVKWTLNRAYRNGVQFGLCKRAEDLPHATSWGDIAWTYVAKCYLAAKAKSTELWVVVRKRAFSLQYRFQWWRGYLRGYHHPLAAGESEAQPSHVSAPQHFNATTMRDATHLDPLVAGEQRTKPPSDDGTGEVSKAA